MKRLVSDLNGDGKDELVVTEPRAPGILGLQSGAPNVEILSPAGSRIGLVRLDDAGQSEPSDNPDACHQATSARGCNDQGPSAMFPITPAGQYTNPLRLGWLRATLFPRPREHETAKGVSQRRSGNAPSTPMRDEDFWHRHLHRLEELDRDERGAVRTSIIMASSVFVMVAALLTVVRLFGLPPETQYAMIGLF